MKIETNDTDRQAEQDPAIQNANSLETTLN